MSTTPTAGPDAGIAASEALEDDGRDPKADALIRLLDEHDARDPDGLASQVLALLHPGTPTPPAPPADQYAHLPQLHAFSDLYLREVRLKARLDGLKKQRAALAPAAEQELLQSGLQKVPFAGATVYTETKFYPGRAKTDPSDPESKPLPMDAVVEPMKANGLGFLIAEGYNHKTFESWVNNERKRILAEKQEAAESNGTDPGLVDVEPEEIIPPGLHGVLVVNEVRTLKAVKS